MPERQSVASGSPFEDTYGYCRAVRVDNVVHVAGTVAWSDDGKVVGADDAYAQAKQAIRNIEKALVEAGSSLQDVVRTRAFLTDISYFGDLTRAHSEAFGDVRPAATMVVVTALAGPEMLVEIEADAVIGSG
jgi:enamine deaminase RidA (YjgF/YER057c/UK114 family)